MDKKTILSVTISDIVTSIITSLVMSLIFVIYLRSNSIDIDTLREKNEILNRIYPENRYGGKFAQYVKYTPTTVMNLIITPYLFHNRKVLVSGYVYRGCGEGGAELFYTKDDIELCDSYRAIDIDIYNNDKNLEQKVFSYNGRYAVIIGRFLYNECNGHFCLYNGTLIVESISETPKDMFDRNRKK